MWSDIVPIISGPCNYSVRLHINEYGISIFPSYIITI